MSLITDRILKMLDDPTLIEKLLSLSNADRNSLLLEVFSRQSKQTVPKDVLKLYQANRFTFPSDASTADYHTLEAELLLSAQEQGVTTVLLSPCAPLGSCSSFGCVDQNNIVSALRGTETLSDPSNMLAIIIADKLKTTKSDASIHYATTARVVRAQPFSGKGFYAHFGIYCMVSAGKANGSYACEDELLKKHLTYYAQLIHMKYDSKASIVLRKRSGYPDGDGFFSQMAKVIRETFPDVPLSFDYDDVDNQYYKGINFKIYMEQNGETFEIGDGGFVDWVTQMLGDKRERCLISGIGIDRLLLLSRRNENGA